MERRDDDSVKSFTQVQDDKKLYISLSIPINIILGSLFYFYSINSPNQECHQLSQTSFYYAFYCLLSLIITMLILIGEKVYNTIITCEGLFRLLFLIAFILGYLGSSLCLHLQSLTIVFVSLHIILFLMMLTKCQINKTKQL